jgi:hypothetical protein
MHGVNNIKTYSKYLLRVHKHKIMEMKISEKYYLDFRLIKILFNPKKRHVFDNFSKILKFVNISVT